SATAQPLDGKRRQLTTVIACVWLHSPLIDCCQELLDSRVFLVKGPHFRQPDSPAVAGLSVFRCAGPIPSARRASKDLVMVLYFRGYANPNYSFGAGLNFRG